MDCGNHRITLLACYVVLSRLKYGDFITLVQRILLFSSFALLKVPESFEFIANVEYLPLLSGFIYHPSTMAANSSTTTVSVSTSDDCLTLSATALQLLGDCPQ